jgi:hypothetical protein
MADDEKHKRDLREGRTEPGEDEYGKVRSDDDADGETAPNTSRVEPLDTDEFSHANDDD